MSPDCPPPNVVQGVIHTTPPKSEASLPNQKVSSIKSTKGMFPIKFLYLFTISFDDTQIVQWVEINLQKSCY